MQRATSYNYVDHLKPILTESFDYREVYATLDSCGGTKQYFFSQKHADKLFKKTIAKLTEHIRKTKDKYNSIIEKSSKEEREKEANFLQSIQDEIILHNMRLRKVQQYGVQKLHEHVSVYTLEYYFFDAHHTPWYNHKGKHSHEFLDKKSARKIIDLQEKALTTADEKCFQVFGYPTLQEAQNNSPELTELLKHYSIEEIFQSIKDSGIPNAMTVSFDVLSKYTGLSALVVEDVYEKGILLMHQTVNTIYSQMLEAMLHPDVPIDWLIEAVDFTLLQDEVYSKLYQYFQDSYPDAQINYTDDDA